jgi:hypothetical protein
MKQSVGLLDDQAEEQTQSFYKIFWKIILKSLGTMRTPI